MRIATLVLIVIAPALLAGCSSGPRKPPRWSPNAPSRSENYHGGTMGMIMHYDANHDKILTRAELEAGLHAEFDALDTNHTGCLTGAQVEAINQKRIAADESAASPLIDWSGNGCLDYNEYAATARSLFESLDKNGDGELTPGEYNPRKTPHSADDTVGAGTGGPGGY